MTTIKYVSRLIGFYIAITAIWRPVQVISTFQTAAELGSQSLGAYVISMAHDASDVLAVELLQKEALMTVGNTRFISSKSSAQLNTVSPLLAQANTGASVQGQISAPFVVPSTVHGSRSGNLHATTSDTSIASGMLSEAHCSVLALYCAWWCLATSSVKPSYWSLHPCCSA